MIDRENETIVDIDWTKVASALANDFLENGTPIARLPDGRPTQSLPC